MTDKRAQSYIWHVDTDTAYFVSTIERESSAAAAYGLRYYKTMVWEWDEKTRERNHDFLYQGGDARILSHHFAVCALLATEGKDGLAKLEDSD